jgi:hypothetical protein
MTRLDNTQKCLSAYKQYKQGTEYIAGWLAETAQSLGHKLREAQNPPKPKAKCKGSKGKKNRNAGKSGGKRNLIRTAGFVPLADSIISNSTNVLVPVPLSKLFS